MTRLTFEGNFCNIAQCRGLPCPYNSSCSQRKAWERLKAYEDTGLEPESVEALKLSVMGKAISEITEFDGLPIDRLRDLAEADKDGRVVVLAPEERTLDFPVKYTEICALYHFCVDLGIKCTIERLHDGYAVRFPDGSDFAQHHGTYGGTEGCVEPAIGDSEFDYTAVGLNLAKKLVKKHKGKLEADHACRMHHPRGGGSGIGGGTKWQQN